MSLILIFIFFSSINFILSKNLFFPFKKLTIEYLNESKTISDFITFNIYTNVSMGTPQKKVAHFILQGNQLFSYRTMKLQYHSSSEFDKIEEEIKKAFENFFITKDSTSFKVIEDYFGLYSDVITFYDKKGENKTKELQFNIRPNDIKDKLCGNMDLLYPVVPDDPEDPDDDYDRYFFNVLKSAGLIDKSYFTFIYGDYNYGENFNYFDENYHNIYGNLILGEGPHEFNPEKYKEEDEIKIYRNFSNEYVELKLKSKISNYTEKNSNLTFRFNSEFIKGNLDYKNEIDNIFFNELFSKNICKIEIVEENIYINKDIVYSCENSNLMKEKIKYFPTIYFEAKQSNLTFLFNYKELFKIHHDRIYFLIFFKNNSLSTDWDFGDLFLRKYTTAFNYDSKTMSLYRQQVNEINNKTDIPYPDDEESDVPKSDEVPKENGLSVSTIVIIVMGGALVIAGVIISAFIIRWKRTRKKRADELKDDYEYIPEEKVN